MIAVKHHPWSFEKNFHKSWITYKATTWTFYKKKLKLLRIKLSTHNLSWKNFPSDDGEIIFPRYSARSSHQFPLCYFRAETFRRTYLKLKNYNNTFSREWIIFSLLTFEINMRASVLGASKLFPRARVLKCAILNICTCHQRIIRNYIVLYYIVKKNLQFMLLFAHIFFPIRAMYIYKY